MIFYSSSPEPHVAQILGGKLWAEIRNAATSTTHLEHRSGSTKQPSTSSIHVPDTSAHSSGPLCGGTFKRKATTDWSALMPSVRFKCFTCCCLFCTEIRRCNDGRAFLVRKSVDQWLYGPEVDGNAAETEGGVVPPLTWGFIWSKKVH